MQKDCLAELIATVEKDCQNDNTQVFYGTIEENDFSPMHHVSFDRKDWQQYFKLIRALDAKVITLSVDKNEMDDAGEIKTFLENLDEDIRESYTESLKIVEKTRGHVAAFTVSFIHGFMNYQFTREADWYTDYQFVNGVYEEEAMDEDDDELEEDHAKTIITEEQIEQLARIVISRPVYLQAKNEFQRKSAFYEMEDMKDIGTYWIRTKVRQRAESIFMEEVYPKMEEELRNKVLALKQQKCTKGQIKAKLNISDNTLNRHW
jgi:hypothetical protein